jgi:adenylate kinase
MGLKECGLLSVLEWANNGKVIGECQMCKLSREAQERLAREAAVAAAAEGTDDVITDTTGNGVRESMRTDGHLGCCGT